MTKLMKYEADFEKGLTHECYQSWLEIEISDNKRRIATLESKIRMYKYEIKQLKSQLTWRPVRDPPKKDGEYFVMTAGGDIDKMRFNQGYWLIWDDEVSGYFLLMFPPLKWLPIPPAPEEI